MKAAPTGMLAIGGGPFWMGSDEHYPEEAPARPVRVAGFLLDRAPVTNRDFAEGFAVRQLEIVRP